MPENRFACLAAFLGLLVSGPSEPPEPLAREITFEERVAAQEAIERVYYSYQLGATRPFHEVISRALLEEKVITYLKQSAALAEFWMTPVTAHALRSEMERLASTTRMPERLRELYEALGNDPFLIQECLARPALVNRMARSFVSHDERIQGSRRAMADSLQSRLAGGLDVSEAKDVIKRNVLVVKDDQVAAPHGSPSGEVPLVLSSEEFEEYRRDMGDLRVSRTEAENEYVLRRLESSRNEELLLTEYRVRKTSWNEWWNATQDEWDPDGVLAVADLRAFPLPVPPMPVTPPATWTTVSVPLRPECAEDGEWADSNMDDSPQGRRSHTAVWTGSLMLVWGGSSDSGSRYDPTTDTWSRITNTNAPSGAGRAVWTGTEMIVVGAGMGGRYDPATDTWQRFSIPFAVSDPATAWSGTELIVWGGEFNTGGRYDPAIGQWRTMSLLGAPTPRSRYTRVWTGSKLIIWGGIQTTGYYTDTGAMYTPQTDSWFPILPGGVPAPEPRFDAAGVWTGSELIVWGGFGVANVLLNTGGRYNLSTNGWWPLAVPPGITSQSSLSAVWTGDQMLLWGLEDANGKRGARYDPDIDAWQAIEQTNAPGPRWGFSAVWTGSHMIIWGGEELVELDSGGRYDPITNTWTPTGTPERGGKRWRHTAVWTGDQMLLWGGGNATGYRYDPILDAWSAMSTLNSPGNRTHHTAVWTGESMIVYGGWESIDTGARYDPISDIWSPVTQVNSPPGRYNHTAVWTGSLMLVWGGWTGLPYATGGLYDPALDQWTPMATANAPSTRSEHSAAWTGDKMIVWGGSDGAPLATGGSYSPATNSWTPISNASAPTRRYRHAALWTGEEMIIWGGNIWADGADGGRYAPASNTWHPMTTVNAPTPTDAAAAVWTGEEMIVWGGSTAPGHPRNTGGRYDPDINRWRATPLHRAPFPREYHTAIWTGESVIVWGGTWREFTDYGFADGAILDYTLPIDNDGDGYFTCNGDCDDNQRSVYPGAIQVCGDGLNNACTAQWPLLIGTNEADDDHDGFTECGGDCNDANGTIRPGIPEVCNGTDDNCDGVTDEGYDNDGDGLATCLGDCDDTQAGVYPGAPQLCGDGLNNDCAVPGWPDIAGTNDFDDDSDGFTECQGDCNDVIAQIFPGAPQLCGDGLNNDCSDQSWPLIPEEDFDADSDHFAICEGDCDDTRDSVYPGKSQLCGDGLNNNCSDPSWPALPAGERDADQDGAFLCAGDCNDLDSRIRPQGQQVCDGVNNNCAHPSWPGLSDTNEFDNDGDAYSSCQGDCNDSNMHTYPHAPESNDGQDNQCAGDAGYNVTDEISGIAGFGTPGDLTGFCWTPQTGATLYAPLRADDSHFTMNCIVPSMTSGTCWVDTATPGVGRIFFYLVRSIAPNTGSWGQTSAGVERIIVCDVPLCGNGVRDVSEVCDGSDLGDETCQSLGFESGTLACLGSCDGYDVTGCRF